MNKPLPAYKQDFILFWFQGFVAQFALKISLNIKIFQIYRVNSKFELMSCHCFILIKNFIVSVSCAFFTFMFIKKLSPISIANCRDSKKKSKISYFRQQKNGVVK